MKIPTIDEALKAISALPPKERAQAIADVRARQLLAATTLVIRLPPEDLAELNDRFPKSVKGMSGDEYRSAKASLISNANTRRTKAADEADLKKINHRHNGKSK